MYYLAKSIWEIVYILKYYFLILIKKIRDAKQACIKNSTHF